MENVSQVIIRNRQLLGSGSLLLINPPRDGLCQELLAGFSGPGLAAGSAANAGAEPGCGSSCHSDSDANANPASGIGCGTAHPGLAIHTQDYGDYRWFMEQGLTADFGVLPGADEQICAPPAAGATPWPAVGLEHPRDTDATAGFDSDFGMGAGSDAAVPWSLPHQVIVFQPREKDRLEMLLHYLSSRLPPQACIWLVGENQAGIRSAGKRLDTYFSQVSRLDNARHGKLFRAAHPAPPGPFKLEAYLQTWTLDRGGQALKLVSLPGTFAHGRVDSGTAFLLDYLASQAALDGSLLDFGCGTGVIGLTALQRNPQLQIALVDSAATALGSACLTLAANDLATNLCGPTMGHHRGPASQRHHATPGADVAEPAVCPGQQPAAGPKVAVLAADGLGDVGGRFDWIISNPPFHRGVATDMSITQRFIADAGRRLSSRGKLLIVCNRHLPYEGWLAAHFEVIENCLANHDFKVLLAQRPSTRNSVIKRPGKPAG